MLLALLFFSGIIAIAFQHGFFSLIVCIGFVSLLFFHKKRRFLTALLLSFLIGFALFMLANHYVGMLVISAELKIILNRLFLTFILISISVTHFFYNRKLFWYNNKPDWTNPIILPFHHVNTLTFWLIGLAVNLVIYSVFIFQKDLEDVLLFCLGFSLINAVLEEVIWRGVMLSALKESTTTEYAVLVTSVGFGLLHLAIGFSMLLSLSISIAGVIYAIFTLKTNSIYPSLLFHFIINIGMVYSGFII